MPRAPLHLRSREKAESEVIPAPSEDDRARWFTEGCALSAEIQKKPDWRVGMEAYDIVAVLEFPRRGQARASELAVRRLELIYRRVYGA